MVVGFEGFVGYKRIGGESSRRTFLLGMIFNVLYFGKISYDYDFEIFVEIVNNSLFFFDQFIRINKFQRLNPVEFYSRIKNVFPRIKRAMLNCLNYSSHF